jgi:hypothetical protein
MSLIKCPDCGREVSDAAPACPGCGRPAAGGSQAAPVAIVNTPVVKRAGAPYEAAGTITALLGVCMMPFTFLGGAAILVIGVVIFIAGRLQ